MEVSSDHFQLRCMDIAESQRDSDKFDLSIYLSIKINQVNMNLTSVKSFRLARQWKTSARLKASNVKSFTCAR